MFMYSVTKNEMLKGEVKSINQNTAAGLSPLEMLARWSGQTDASVRHEETDWRPLFPADLAWWACFRIRAYALACGFLVALRMNRCRMLDVGYFICENPKVIKVLTEEENTNLSPRSSHNYIHTMEP